MRPFWGFFGLILAGIVIASSVAYQSFYSGKGLAYDDEQQGLDEQIVIKFSHVVAENTPKGMAVRHFARLVEKYTDHTVKVEIYPNQSLYSDKDEMDALKDNEVQMIAPATSQLTNLVPQLQLLDLPYMFPTYPALQEALTGEIGEALIKELDKKGIKGHSFWVNNFKQISSNSVVRTPADFKGKNFRIMSSKVLEYQFGHFGATTSVLEFNETFKNLESNQLDSQENTLSNIHSKKLYQVQKYLTISEHGFLGYGVLMNEGFWNSLSPEIQQEINKAMEETTKWLWVASQKINEEQLAEIKKKSALEIYRLSTEEKLQWMEEMEIIYKQFEKNIGIELIDKAMQIRKREMKNL